MTQSEGAESAAGLRKGLGLLSSTMMGFLTAAILPDVAVVFTEGLTTGGPVVLFWAFFASLFANLVIATCLAEICSAYPTSGSVYNWSAQMVPAKLAPFASYITGWFNFFGYIAMNSVMAVTFANFLDGAVIIGSGEYYNKDQRVLWALFAAWTWAAANLLRIDEMGLFHTVMGVLHAGTIVVLICSMLTLSYRLNSTHSVFFEYHNETGFSSSSYVTAIGIIVPAFCFLGYDAAAHLADETENAEFNAPAGILSTCLMTGISGICLLIALLYTVFDVDEILTGISPNSMINIFYLYLPRAWAAALSWLVAVNVYFAGLAGLGVCARVTYSLAKDKAMPMSSYLVRLTPMLQSPIFSIFFASSSTSALILVVLADTNEVAFNSLVGLAVVGMQVSYALPIFFKLVYNPRLPTTPFSLGWMSPVLGVISCCWVSLLTILAFIPTRYPYTVENFNWAFLVAIIYGIISALNWQFNSRHYFVGPAKISHENLDTVQTSGDQHKVTEDTKSPLQHFYE